MFHFSEEFTFAKPAQLSKAAILRPVGALAALALASQLATGSVTVTAGDTLYSLALANNTTVDQLVDANNIDNPDLIRIGQQVVVPQASVTQPGPIGVQPEHSIEYTVAAGDTLYGIARRHGVSVRSLVLANGLKNKRLISIGQVLRVPGSQPSTPPPATTPPATTPPATAPPATTAPTTPPTTSAPVSTPPTTAAPATSPPVTVAPVLQTGVTTIYAVRQGDTLASIAARYGTTPQALIEANNLTSPDLYVGQYLLVRG